jgi:transcriptional regulator with XRE-family HTH domain
MNELPNWTDADANKLRDARENAGFDLFTFARKNSLSNAQLLELEQGGESYFYSASIKYSVGKKLLNSFEVRTEFERLKDESEAQSNSNSLVVEAFLEESVQHLQSTNTGTESRASKLLLILIILVAIFLAVVFVNYPNYKANNDLDKKPSTTQFSQIEKLNESNNQFSITQSNAVAEPIVQTSKIELAANECIWSQNIPNLSAQNPSKDGNYVYLVATKEVVVCIKDNTSKVSIVDLKANEPQNIAGVSPFTLQSKDLDSLNIFYQGSKVQLPSKNTTEVKLVAIPVQ